MHSAAVEPAAVEPAMEPAKANSQPCPAEIASAKAAKITAMELVMRNEEARIVQRIHSEVVRMEEPGAIAPSMPSAPVVMVPIVMVPIAMVRIDPSTEIAPSVTVRGIAPTRVISGIVSRIAAVITRHIHAACQTKHQNNQSDNCE